MLLSTVFALALTATTFMASDNGDQLLEKYQTLKTSLYNQRGFAPGDKETTRKLRDEMTAWTTTHDDLSVISCELQLSIWLEDVEVANTLFGRLSKLQPNNAAFALAWGNYMSSQPDADVDTIYSDLMDRFPNTPEVNLEWARILDSKNQFSKAIDVIERIDTDSLRSPETATFYASLLYANNRFEDSLATLETIDSGELSSNPAISSQISATRTRSQSAQDLWQEEISIREVEEIAADLPLVAMQTSKGPIEIELFEDHAPNTVANFISLVNSGYYDGILFHRVIPKFMAQGGDPRKRKIKEDAATEDGPGYSIADEHTNEDHRNHFAGSLSMANKSLPNTGGSQFFLTHLPTPHLDGKHTVFGRITSGLDNARALEKDDEIISVMVIRKRDHEYTPEKIGEKKVEETPKLNPDRTPSLNSGVK